MLNWTIERLNLYLKYTWKLSRSETNSKTNFYIKLHSKGYSGIGEVAPNERYKETPQKVLSEFAVILNNELPIVKDINGLQSLLEQFKICNSLRFGIESAYIDWFCKKEKISPYVFMGIKKIPLVQTAFTIPIMETSRLSDFFLKNNLHRFKYIKVKVNAENAYEVIREMDNITDQPLMIDGNEAWTDVEQLLKFFETVKEYNIEFIEQPLPSSMDEEYYYLREESPLVLMADESMTDKPDFIKLKRQFHGVNMKLMKAGGLQNGLRILREARAYDLKTMVGCMVETGVGISNGMYLADSADYIDLDSFLYIENEESKLIKEHEGSLSFIN